MDHDLQQAVEAVIFAAGTPTRLTQLQRAFPSLSKAQLAQIVKETNEALRTAGRPYEIIEVAGGYQFRSRLEFGEIIRSAQPERKTRLSRAALETLAVIAYRQPITRVEVEELRSVDCGAVLKGLLERDLVRMVGRRDAPGRPVLYGSTSNFLEIFGLGSLRDLPSLKEVDADPKEGTSAEDALQSLAPDDEPASEVALDEDSEPETIDESDGTAEEAEDEERA